MTTVDPRRLSVFRRVVELQSFQAAADSLSMSQSALSQQIGRLEEEIGVKLLDRSRRPVRMTDIGRRIYAASREVEDAVDRLAGMIDMSNSGQEGTVRVGLVPSLMTGFVPGVFDDFVVENPNVTISITYDTTVELLDQLEDGRIDAALLYMRSQDNRIHSTRLYEDEYVAVVNDRNPLSQRAEIRFADLRDETLIMVLREAAPENFDAIIAACRASNFSPKAIVAPGSYQLHMGLVSAGKGISFCPRTVAALSATNLTTLPLTDPAVPVGIHLARFPARGGALLDRLTEFLERHCPDRAIQAALELSRKPGPVGAFPT